MSIEGGCPFKKKLVTFMVIAFALYPNLAPSLARKWQLIFDLFFSTLIRTA
jgi:nitrate reductase NapE component